MSSFERKTLENGQPNPKYIDLCDEDQPIAGQKFTCLSFVSPEKILKKRETFLFDQFIKQWDFTKSLSKFLDFLHFISYKYNLNTDEITNDLSTFCKEETASLSKESVEDDYKTFLDKHSEQLDLEYNKKHDFQTSTRGIKIRGVFPTQEEAEMRAKMLREHDPFFDVYVGPVGLWMPWEPDAYKTGNINFLEDQLNDLMANKKKNEETAKEYFDQRVKETKIKAHEENKKKAMEHGNKLTQTIDENGNLVNIKNMDEVKNALFGTNIEKKG
jgi:hypothetical protein